MGQDLGSKVPKFLQQHATGTPNGYRRLTFVPATRADVPPPTPGVHFIALNNPDQVTMVPAPAAQTAAPGPAVGPKALPQVRELFKEENIKLKWSDVRRAGAGLQNLGNTCFMNSVLQCLTHTPPLAEAVLGGLSGPQPEAADPLTVTISHIKRALNATGRIIAPRQHCSILRILNKRFRLGRQEDSHEFLRCLLDAMHEACLKPFKPKPPPELAATTVINRIFGGKLRSKIRCYGVDYESNTYEDFMDLSLEINRATNLLRALQHFTAKEQLDGDNKYRCPKNNKLVKADKQITIESAPAVLTIHLKRFQYGGYGSKITKHVEFQEEVNLQHFMSDPDAGPQMYDLYGVLVHLGSTVHSGHYYCFVKAGNGMWHKCDDERVSQVGQRQVMAQNAYILFYVRRHPRHRKPSKVQPESKVPKSPPSAHHSPASAANGTATANGSPGPATNQQFVQNAMKRAADRLANGHELQPAAGGGLVQVKAGKKAKLSQPLLNGNGKHKAGEGEQEEARPKKKAKQQQQQQQQGKQAAVLPVAPSTPERPTSSASPLPTLHHHQKKHNHDAASSDDNEQQQQQQQQGVGSPGPSPSPGLKPARSAGVPLQLTSMHNFVQIVQSSSKKQLKRMARLRRSLAPVMASLVGKADNGQEAGGKKRKAEVAKEKVAVAEAEAEAAGDVPSRKQRKRRADVAGAEGGAPEVQQQQAGVQPAGDDVVENGGKQKGGKHKQSLHGSAAVPEDVQPQQGEQKQRKKHKGDPQPSGQANGVLKPSGGSSDVGTGGAGAKAATAAQAGANGKQKKQPESGAGTGSAAAAGRGNHPSTAQASAPASAPQEEVTGAAAAQLLKHGLVGGAGKGVVAARWNADDAPLLPDSLTARPQGNGTRVLDEWDEEYDRGKVKKVRDKDKPALNLHQDGNAFQRHWEETRGGGGQGRGRGGGGRGMKRGGGSPGGMRRDGGGGRGRGGGRGGVGEGGARRGQRGRSRSGEGRGRSRRGQGRARGVVRQGR